MIDKSRAHLLLTGAGGFLGHHTLEHVLETTNWNVTITDSFRHHGCTDRVREVLEARPHHRERVDVITHDLTTPWSSVLIHRLHERFGKVSAIFNIASESHVQRSIDDPVPFVRNNCELMLSMLELARAVNPRVFLQVSTDEVYGSVPFGRPCQEWDPTLPSNPYSSSKAAQEAFAIAWWRTYHVPVVIVNAMNLIGERQDPEKFVPQTIARVLAGEEMTIHVSPEGKPGSRIYLHCRNLADAMCFIANRVPARYPDVEFPDRFNVPGEEEVDNHAMASRIAEIIGKPLRSNFVDFTGMRPGHDARYALDGAKIREAGWKQPVPLWESLERVVRWSTANQQWLSLRSNGPLAA